MTANGQENRTITRDEGRALLDASAWRNLGISGEDFITKWDSGELRGEQASRRVMRVAMLLPLGR